MSAPPTIRRARPDDHAAFVRLFPELGVDDPVPARERWLAGMASSTTVLEVDGTVAAYCFAESLGDSGYVRQIVVDPARRGGGHGRALLSAVLAELRARGARQVRLNVKADNLAAIRLYESLGFRAAYGATAFRLPAAVVAALPAGDASVLVRDLRADEDAAVEATWSLLAGQLASARSAGRQVLALADAADAPVGLAIFEPAFPRAFPFRLARPTLARAFLTHLLARVTSPAPLVVVAEADDALAAALRTAGAEVRHEIVHMSAD